MVKITLNNYLNVPTGILDKEIEALFSIYNPDYLSICKRRGLRRSEYPEDFIVTKYKENGVWKTARIPEKLFYWKRSKGKYRLPRGAFFELKKLLKVKKVKYRLIDKRVSFESQNFNFLGKLREEFGQNAVERYNLKNSIVEAPTGSGKTVMALYIAAKINQPFIIVVDTKELQNQWVERIRTFLGVPKVQIGHVGGGKIKEDRVTVALIQTLKKNTQILKNYGLMIVDECHVAATESYGMAVNKFRGKYVLGLSATPSRKDGKTEVMKWLLGDIRTKVNFEEAERTPASVKFVPTRFNSSLSFQFQYSKALVGLTENRERNQLIIKTILDNLDHPGVHLILSQSAKHLKILMELLPVTNQSYARLLIGSVKDSDRKKIISDMKTGKIKTVFATSQLLGKGFDEPLLSVLHLTTPIKDSGRLTQYIGRITRIHNDKKKSLVFDYYDTLEPILAFSAKARLETYQDLKMEIVK